VSMRQLSLLFLACAVRAQSEFEPCTGPDCPLHIPSIDSAYEAERFNVVRLTDANIKGLTRNGVRVVVVLVQASDEDYGGDFLSLGHAFRDMLHDGVLCGILDKDRYQLATKYLGLSSIRGPTIAAVAVDTKTGKIKKPLMKIELQHNREEEAVRSAAERLSKLLRLEEVRRPVAKAELLSQDEELQSRVFHKNASVALMHSDDAVARSKVEAYCDGLQPGSLASIDRITQDQLDRRSYLCKYAVPGRPFVLIGATEEWPARTKWTPQYFAEKFGNAQLHPDLGIEDWHSAEVTLGELVEAIGRSGNQSDPPWSVIYGGFSMGDRADRYGGRINDFLKEDYTTPDIFRKNNWLTCMENRCQQDMTIFFMGAKGSRQSNHQDHFSSSKWQTQIYGRKRWILHPPELSHALYYGKVDPFFPDFKQYPRYKAAMQQRFDVIVEAGDIMWWPSGWWHATEALDDTIGLARNLVDEHNFQSFEISMIQFCDWADEDYPLENQGSYCGCMKRNHKRWKNWYEAWRKADGYVEQMDCPTHYVGVPHHSEQKTEL